ncbi:MAG: PHP domain-containing protein [Candidatus Limnocylindria bacterium]
MSSIAPAIRLGPRAREATGGPPSERRAFADFHIHTRFSRDSILAEDKFIRIAMERGLTHVAITNHNNVEGAVAVRERVDALGVADRLTVILGEEVSTADGEVVGLFLWRTIPRGLSADETCDEIHAQGGLVSVPHPFDPFRPSHITRVALERLAEAGRIDVIEIFNSRVTLGRHNLEAAEFAARYGIPGIACSDTHSSFEIAMSVNALPAFDDAAALKAALPHNEWSGSRSTTLIHLTTRYAVWSNVIRRRLGRETAAAPVLGPAAPQQAASQPVEVPVPAELPDPNAPEAASDRG